MYNNVGAKIKGLANFIMWLGIIISIISGIAIFIFLGESHHTDDFAFFGIIIAIVGPIMSWLSGLLMYGFGELIAQTMQINKKLNVEAMHTNGKSRNHSKSSNYENNETDQEKLSKLNEWKKKELISEKEYSNEYEKITGKKPVKAAPKKPLPENPTWQDLLDTCDFSDITLEELKEMLDYGEITPEEYEIRKKEILKNM